MEEKIDRAGVKQPSQTVARRTVLQAGGGLIAATMIEPFSGRAAIAAEPRSKSLPRKYKKLVGVKVSDKFAESVTVIEVDMPTLAADDILVRTTLAAVSGADFVNTPRGADAAKQKQWHVGVETVGEIVAVGSGVTKRKVGERVFVYTRRDGAYAEYRLVKAEDCFPYAGVSDEFASTFGSSLVAILGLEEVGRMTSNEVVFVSAAAGGVGTFVVQMAKAAGNHVIGSTSKDEKVEYLRSIGCDRPINYKKENIGAVFKKEYPKGINIAYDTVGGSTFDDCLSNLATRGRIVSAGFISEMGPTGTSAETVTKPRIYMNLMGGSKIVGGIFKHDYVEKWPAAMAKIQNLAEQKKLTVQIDPKPFRGVASAIEAVPHAAYGGNTGKVVVRFDT